MSSHMTNGHMGISLCADDMPASVRITVSGILPL